MKNWAGTKKILRCSFCRKPLEAVGKMICSPAPQNAVTKWIGISRVYICDECVAVCNSLLEGDRRKSPQNTTANQLPLESQGHCERVTAFTIAIARAMGVPKKQIRIIARAALLHDIGKMPIPYSILLKPGQLTEVESAVMREHCWLGYRILKRIDFLPETADIVYAQQERFDGTGYPRGLKGNQIPMGARIFAVAHTLEAITTDRPYRPRRPVSAAREEIGASAGRQFDPEIVETFLSMPEKIWYDLCKELDPPQGEF